MSAIGALNQGLQGIQSGFSNLRRDAHQIAKSNEPEQSSGDLAKSMVNLISDRTQISANAKVIQTAAEMMDTVGSILDVKA